MICTDFDLEGVYIFNSVHKFAAKVISSGTIFSSVYRRA
jgi:hypothetical protein